MKTILVYTLVLLIAACTSTTNQAIQIKDGTDEIKNVLSTQQKAWNDGDLDSFMEGYWKSDSMQFVGSSIRQGWHATLARYKESYPSREAMGTLQFDIWQVVRIANDAYLVTGKYTLLRANDKPTGPFTLIFRLKEGKWVIVYDHTS